MFFGAAIIPIENKYSKGVAALTLDNIYFLWSLVFAKKTSEACPIILVVNSAGCVDLEFSVLV
ncbi:hypothetical protein DIC82_08595 [Clostridium beijerinckii]|nr:hypothetical protein DIC82_08595 [Clostridium beijerinckii]